MGDPDAGLTGCRDCQVSDCHAAELPDCQVAEDWVVEQPD